MNNELFFKICFLHTIKQFFGVSQTLIMLFFSRQIILIINIEIRTATY